MKCPSLLPSRHPRLACIVTLATATLLGAASAADMPKRKPGLWELKFRHSLSPPDARGVPGTRKNFRENAKKT